MSYLDSYNLYRDTLINRNQEYSKYENERKQKFTIQTIGRIGAASLILLSPVRKVLDYGTKNLYRFTMSRNNQFEYDLRKNATNLHSQTASEALRTSITLKPRPEGSLHFTSDYVNNLHKVENSYVYKEMKLIKNKLRETSDVQVFSSKDAIKKYYADPSLLLRLSVPYINVIKQEARAKNMEFLKDIPQEYLKFALEFSTEDLKATNNAYQYVEKIHSESPIDLQFLSQSRGSFISQLNTSFKNAGATPPENLNNLNVNSAETVNNLTRVVKELRNVEQQANIKSFDLIVDKIGEYLKTHHYSQQMARRAIRKEITKFFHNVSYTDRKMVRSINTIVDHNTQYIIATLLAGTKEEKDNLTAITDEYINSTIRSIKKPYLNSVLRETKRLYDTFRISDRSVKLNDNYIALRRKLFDPVVTHLVGEVSPLRTNVWNKLNDNDLLSIGQFVSTVIDYDNVLTEAGKQKRIVVHTPNSQFPLFYMDLDDYFNGNVKTTRTNQETFVNSLINKFKTFYSNTLFKIASESVDDNGNIRITKKAQDLALQQIKLMRSQNGNAALQVTEDEINQYIASAIDFFRTQTFEFKYLNAKNDLNIPLMMTSPGDILANRQGRYTFRGAGKAKVSNKLAGNKGAFQFNAVQAGIEDTHFRYPSETQITSFGSLLNEKINKLLANLLNIANKTGQYDAKQINKLYEDTYNRLLESYGVMVENLITNINSPVQIFKTSEQIKTSSRFNKSLENQLILVQSTINKIKQYSGQNVLIGNDYYNMLTSMETALLNLQHLRNTKQLTNIESLYDSFQKFLSIGNVALQAGNRSITSFTIYKGSPEYFVGATPGSKPPGIKTAAYSESNFRTKSRSLFITPAELGHRSPAMLRGFSLFFPKISSSDSSTLSTQAYGISEGSIFLTAYGKRALKTEKPFHTVTKSIELTYEQYANFYRQFAIGNKNIGESEYNEKLLKFINKEMNDSNGNTFDTITSINEINDIEGKRMILTVEGKKNLDKSIRISKYYYNPAYNEQTTKIFEKADPALKTQASIANGQFKEGYLLAFNNLSILAPTEFSLPIAKTAVPYVSIIQDSIRQPMQLATGLFNTLMEIIKDKLNSVNSSSKKIAVGDFNRMLKETYKLLFRDIFGINKKDYSDLISDINFVSNNGKEYFQIALRTSDPIILEQKYHLGDKFNNFLLELYREANSKNQPTPLIDKIISSSNKIIETNYPMYKNRIEITKSDIIRDLSSVPDNNVNQPIIMSNYPLAMAYAFPNGQMAFVADLAPIITTEEKYAIYSNQVAKNWSTVKSNRTKGAKLNQYNLFLSSFNMPNFFKYSISHMEDNFVFADRLQYNYATLFDEGLGNKISKLKVIKGLPVEIVDATKIIQNIFDKTAEIHNRIAVSSQTDTAIKYPNVESASENAANAKVMREATEFTNAFIERIRSSIQTNELNRQQISEGNILRLADEAINEQQRTATAFFEAIEQVYGSENIANKFTMLDLNAIQSPKTRITLSAGDKKFSGYMPLIPAYADKVLTTVSSGYDTHPRLNSLYQVQTRILLLKSARSELTNRINEINHKVSKGEPVNIDEINNLNTYNIMVGQIDKSLQQSMRDLTLEYVNGLSGKEGAPAMAMKVTSTSSIIPAYQFIDPAGFADDLEDSAKTSLNQYLYNAFKIIKNDKESSLETTKLVHAFNYLSDRTNYFKNNEIFSNGINHRTASYLLDVLDRITHPYNINGISVNSLVEQQLMREMLYNPLNKVFISEGAVRGITSTALESYTKALGLDIEQNTPALKKLVDLYVEYVKQRGALGVVSREPEHTTKSQLATVLTIGATKNMQIENIQPSNAIGKMMHQDFDSDVMKVFLSETEVLKTLLEASAEKKIDISKLDYNEFEKIILSAGQKDTVVKGNLEDVIYNNIKNFAFIPESKQNNTKAIYAPILDKYILTTKNRDQEIRSVSVKDYIRDLLITHAGYDPSDQTLDKKTTEILNSTLMKLGAETNIMSSHVNEMRIAIGTINLGKTSEEVENLRTKISNDILLQMGVTPETVNYDQILKNVNNVINGTLSEEAFQAYTNTKVIPPKVTLKLFNRLVTAQNLISDKFTIESIDAFYDVINNTAIDSKHGFLNFADGIMGKLNELGSVLNSINREKVDQVAKILKQIKDGDYKITLMDSRYNMTTDFQSKVISYINSKQASSRPTGYGKPRYRIGEREELTLRDFNDFYKAIIQEGTTRLKNGESGNINIDIGGISIALKDAIRIQAGLEHIKTKIGQPFQNIENANVLLESLDSGSDKFLSSLMLIERQLSNDERIKTVSRAEQGIRAVYPEEYLNYLSNEIDRIKDPKILNPDLTVPWINSALNFINNARKGGVVDLMSLFNKEKSEMINMKKVLPVASGAPAILTGAFLASSVLSLINGGSISPIKSIDNTSNLDYFDYGLHQEKNSLHKYKTRIQLVKPENTFKLAKHKEYSDQADLAFIGNQTKYYGNKLNKQAPASIFNT